MKYYITAIRIVRITPCIIKISYVSFIQCSALVIFVCIYKAINIVDAIMIENILIAIIYTV